MVLSLPRQGQHHGIARTTAGISHLGNGRNSVPRGTSGEVDAPLGSVTCGFPVVVPRSAVATRAGWLARRATGGRFASSQGRVQVGFGADVRCHGEVRTSMISRRSTAVVRHSWSTGSVMYSPSGAYRRAQPSSVNARYVSTVGRGSTVRGWGACPRPPASASGHRQGRWRRLWCRSRRRRGPCRSGGRRRPSRRGSALRSRLRTRWPQSHPQHRSGVFPR